MTNTCGSARSTGSRSGAGHNNHRTVVSTPSPAQVRPRVRRQTRRRRSLLPSRHRGILPFWKSSRRPRTRLPWLARSWRGRSSPCCSLVSSSCAAVWPTVCASSGLGETAAAVRLLWTFVLLHGASCASRPFAAVPLDELSDCKVGRRLGRKTSQRLSKSFASRRRVNECILALNACWGGGEWSGARLSEAQLSALEHIETAVRFDKPPASVPEPEESLRAILGRKTSLYDHDDQVCGAAPLARLGCVLACSCWQLAAGGVSSCSRGGCGAEGS